jgi:arthrofactin-type cyclic lipopeptide synthetase C
VKIRGFRIELGEIETACSTAKGSRKPWCWRAAMVRTSPVWWRTTHAHAGRLTAPICTRSCWRDCRNTWCRARVQLEVLPLNNNGKVDQGAAGATQAAMLSRVYVAPISALEHHLARIWAGLLQLEQVGRHDNFFELGGHSLLAMRMLSQVRQQLGVELDSPSCSPTRAGRCRRGAEPGGAQHLAGDFAGTA